MRLKPWLWPAAAALVALAAVIVGLLIVDRLGEQAIARQQTAMAGAARDYFVAFARDEGVKGLADTLNRHARVGAADGFHYALEDQSGRMLAGADVVSSLDAPDAGWRTVAEPDSSPRRLWRVLAQPLGGGYTLIVAEDLSARDALRAAVFRGSALAILIAALGAAAAGFGLNAVLLRRTRAIAHTAERIAGGDLSARAPVRPKGDVFDDLGASMNVMLSRIEELMTGMRTVADSIAHDLALTPDPDEGRPGARRRPPRTRGPAATGAGRRARRGRHGAGHPERPSRHRPRRIRPEPREHAAHRRGGPRVEYRRPVRSRHRGRGADAGDRGAHGSRARPGAPGPGFRQAVGNLLHNAVIHAGPGATVVVKVEEAGPGRARICVSDDGPGVPAEHLGRVQERFVRLEASRTTPGSGLGLALVAACAKLHGGRLVLGDNRPGLIAALELSDQRS